MNKKYEELVSELTEKYPERQKEFVTGSSEKVKRLYTQEDTKDVEYDHDIGYPGIYPYTRGFIKIKIAIRITRGFNLFS